MKTVEINSNNLEPLVDMMLKLWPHCNRHEEQETCEKILKSDQQTCFLVQKDEQFIGFVQLALRHDWVEGQTQSPVGYVEGIYVEPTYRYQNIARNLIKVAEEWSIKNGCAELGSDVELGNNDSIAFHKKAGFTEENRIVCFIKKIS